MKDYKKNIIREYYWFTLVELVIVIVILWILSTIAFVAFKDYSSWARDSKRVSEISNLNKWLSLYQVKSWYYPMPEWNISTWVINWVEVAYRWLVWDKIAKLVGYSSSPYDPLDNSMNYIYWVTFDKRQFQIWSILENEDTIAYMPNILDKAMASWEKANVKWNYVWYIKFSTWSIIKKYYIANIPSLLYNFSWSVNDMILDSSKVYYVYNNKWNLPYQIWWIKYINNVSTDLLVKDIFNNQSATLTWVDISQIVNANNDILRENAAKDIFGTWSTPESKAILSDFNINEKEESQIVWTIIKITAWITQTTLAYNAWWETIWGSSCSSVTYSWYTITNLNDWVTQNFIKSIPYWTWDINVTCLNGVLSYWIENINCISNYVLQSWACVADLCTWSAPEFSISNWTQKTWVAWSHNIVPWQCTYVCQSWYYSDWTSCIPASPWYFVAGSWSTSQTPCSPWSYQPSSWQSSCIKAEQWYYVSSAWSSTQIKTTTWQYQDEVWASSYKSCTNKPQFSSYTQSDWLIENACPWGCDSWYIIDWQSCISAIPPVDWLCGDLNNQYLVQWPTTTSWLCNSWIPSAITPNWWQTWPWSWDCNWENNGVNAHCTANKMWYAANLTANLSWNDLHITWTNPAGSIKTQIYYTYWPYSNGANLWTESEYIIYNATCGIKYQIQIMNYDYLNNQVASPAIEINSQDCPLPSYCNWDPSFNTSISIEQLQDNRQYIYDNIWSYKWCQIQWLNSFNMVQIVDIKWPDILLWQLTPDWPNWWWYWNYDEWWYIIYDGNGNPSYNFMWATSVDDWLANTMLINTQIWTPWYICSHLSSLWNWYLPAKNELALTSTNMYLLWWAMGWWTSTEVNSNSVYIWNSYWDWNKNNQSSVYCMARF